MAKGKVPTRDELLAFIRDSATPVGKREIARAWSLKGDQRIELPALRHPLQRERDLERAGDRHDGGLGAELFRLALRTFEQLGRERVVEAAGDDPQPH